VVSSKGSSAAVARAWFAAAFTIFLAGVGTPAHAQLAGHLIDLIDASRRDEHVNVTIQFNCSMRYIMHMPTSSGTETQVRFRPGADCGLGQMFSGLSELPSVSGAEEFLKTVRVEDGAPGEVNLILNWQRQTTYVVAPTGNQRGFVVRIIEAQPKGRGFVQEEAEPNALYAVNLDSRTAAFSADDIAAAGAQFKVPAYVSKIVLDGTTWYRLRLGPVLARKDAEQLLLTAQRTFPRAWLAIGEDEEAAGAAGDVSPTVPPAAPVTPDPPLPDAERAQILGLAQSQLSARNFSRAVELLTVLVRQPEYPDRARAQELLGLARERSGQLAQAKAEYEEYLRRYPRGDAAARVTARLKALALAGRKPRSSGGAHEAAPAWKFSGGVSQLYRRDQEDVKSAGVSFNQSSDNALVNNADFLGRRRGERYDFLGRMYAGYMKNMLTAAGAPGDQTQINAAFMELTDKRIDLTGRFGRQSRGADGIFGTFDGAWLTYRVQPRLTVNATVGYPVDTPEQGVRTNREFAGISASFGTFAQSWDVSTYALEQSLDGHVDRRAVGLETRYFRPGRSLIALVDYDIFFKTLNSATLIGGFSLPASWTASFNLDHRETPILTLHNALIGQPVSSVNQLLVNFTPAQIEQLARDRTAMSDVYAASLTRPIGQRFQFSTDVYTTKVGATAASGGVPATPASGIDRAFQVQLFGSSLWRPSDLHVLSLRYERNPNATTDSIGISSRLPLWGYWRIGPRLQLERIHYASDQSTEMGYLPSVRLERLRSRALIELEAGGDIGRRDMQNPLDNQTAKRYYVSLGYRLGF
jgi:tetratricopeptide (TPR) repeat protein